MNKNATARDGKGNEVKLVDDNGNVSIPVWWSNGSGMMINREGLSPDHPDSYYRILKDRLELVSEDHGYFKYPPERMDKLKSMTKDQLISMIFDLEKTIESMERSGF